MKHLLLTLCISISIVATAQVPKLNSLPTAQATIFLDFDGGNVLSSVWNNGVAFSCANPSIPNSTIIESFNRVAEDYKIFNINVTTDSAKFIAAPLTQRVRVLVTPTNFFAPGNTGIAYMHSFTWGDDTPCFVFANSGTSSKIIGEAASHESGHTLGLAHQALYDMYCNKIDEYNTGQGTGEIGWAPIMGYPVDKIFTTWHNGKRSINCVNQDDIAIIDGKIQGGGLKTDDVVNTITNAPLVTITNDIQVNASGIVNNALDVDVFKLPSITEPTQLKLKITPPTVSNNENIGDVDILVRLLNSAGVSIRTYNYSDSLKAEIDTTLNTGNYYLLVDGTSNINTPSDYGSAGSYALIGTLQTIRSLPIYSLDVRGNTNNGKHVIHWNIQADEPIEATYIEYSNNGSNFARLQKVDHRANSYAYTPLTNATIYYRLQCYLRTGAYKTSNIINLQSEKISSKVSILSSTVNDVINVQVQENMPYQVMTTTGSIISKGTLYSNKLNQLNISNVTNGIYLLRVINNTETITHKILKTN